MAHEATQLRPRLGRLNSGRPDADGIVRLAIASRLPGWPAYWLPLGAAGPLCMVFGGVVRQCRGFCVGATDLAGR